SRRMPSMMSPTMVLAEGVPEIVLGSGGSNRLRSAILQTVVNVVDADMPVAAAVRAPRLHFEDGVVYAEPGADLREVEDGEGPVAALTLRVADDGYVRCNGGARRRMSDQQLLLAREIERELDGDAKQRVSRPPGPNSILSYVVRLESGTVRFADTSPGISKEE